MASTILYKFQAGTNFEALPLPGSAARLFDVKKAIVKAKRLDSGSMEFDLAVRNAETNEEYVNEAMLLPRGTRLIVQRLPASRGQGLLARIARNEQAGMGMMGKQQGAPGSAPSGFYTIESSARDEDEFVQSGGAVDEEKELAALQAVTNMQSDGPAMTGGYAPGPSRSFPAAGGSGGMKPNFQKPQNFRPNADPELRAQEQKLQPKKIKTGIPRTFLNLTGSSQAEGAEGGENESSITLQPNTIGFQELVNRGGGQSENTTGTRRDLDYALKITSTSVPEHLQCGICTNIVKNAMLLPWDPELRTTCETCIRDGLAQNGFQCPLTGIDGVSPDDLLPNGALRKAADAFVKSVMEKVDEIEKQQVEEAEVAADTEKTTTGNILDGDGTEKGVLVSKKATLAGRKKSDDDDPFGGDDDFGGDVFAVEAETGDDEETNDAKEDETNAEDTVDPKERKEENTNDKDKKDDASMKDSLPENKGISVPDSSPNRNGKDLNVSTDSQMEGGERESPEKPSRQVETPTQSRNRRRGPPAGYAMGPAGASRDASQDNGHFDRGMRGGRGFGGRGGAASHYGGYRRGRGYRGGRGGGNRESYGDNRGSYQQPHGRDGDDGQDDDSSRGTKRSWDGQQDGHRDKQHKRWDHDRQDDRYRGDRGDSYDQRNSRNNDHGGFRGGYRGGRGRPRGRGGGGYRGGHGRRY